MLINANKNSFQPGERHYVPLEIRRENYEEVRNRLFNRTDNRPISNRILKVRKKFEDRRKTRKMVIESIHRATEIAKDPRVFLDVKIEGITVKGLLDSGASVSILGKNCREFVQQLGLSVQTMLTNVKTASGQQHRILGKIKLSIKYKEQQHQLLLYLCPDLEQVLYLGIDFWRTFSLAPDVVGIEEIEVEKIYKEMLEGNMEYKMKPHKISIEQQSQLDSVIKSFDSFEEKGLGQTSLEKHSIKLV